METYKCASCKSEIKLVDRYIYENNSTSIKSRLCTVIFNKTKEIKVIDLLSKEHNPNDYKILRKDEIRIFKCPVCNNNSWELTE